MITIYGIKNCDTMKKALKWLDEHGVDYQFHDYKKAGLSAELADHWLDTLGFEALINKRGTTYRKLADEVKDNLDRDSAKALMLDNPSIIKRPLLDLDSTVASSDKLLGFKADQYQQIFA